MMGYNVLLKQRKLITQFELGIVKLFQLNLSAI